MNYIKKYKVVLITLILIAIAIAIYYFSLPQDSKKLPPGYPTDYFDCMKKGGSSVETNGLFSRCKYNNRTYEYDG